MARKNADCPECGNELLVTGAGQRWHAQCRNRSCQAQFAAWGKSKAEAMDVFYRACEQDGLMASVTTRLRAMVEQRGAA